MINDAEIQRHHDAKLCTDFTRCVVGKGKSKTVAFEYTDIDTESLISASFIIGLRLIRSIFFDSIMYRIA